VIILFASGYLQNLAPDLLGQAVDELSAPAPVVKNIYILLGLMMLVAIAVFVTRYIWRYFINGNARNMEAFLRERLFTHFQKLGVHFYHYSKTGDLMAYAINDVNAIRMTFGPAMAMAVNSVVLVAIAIFNMAAGVDTRMALFVLIPTPLIIAVMLLMGREVRVRFKRVQEAFAAISDRVQENISGLRVIKAYVQEAAEVNRFEELNENSRNTNLRMVQMSASMSPAVDLLFGVCFTVSLIYGSALVRRGTISLGDFVAFNGYLTLIIQPIRSVARVVNIISRGLASYRRYDAVLRQPVMITDGEDDAPDGLNHADIEVRRLRFKYPEPPESESNGRTPDSQNKKFSVEVKDSSDKDSVRGPSNEQFSLHDISFTLKPGKSLGVIGRTGSGKTTLANLLVRMYNIPDGTVFIGGVDANRFGLNRLREPVGYVPQDNFLFSASVADNIRFFNPALSDAQVENAARDAAILSNINDFPEGFKTQVGERGMSLSGGQKQRICIARAMIKQPALLILDDSLSAVDTRTESEIIANISKQTQGGGSCVIIAHRVSALAACDEIIVLERGRIIERGSHDELIERDGVYAGIAHDQLMDEDDNGNEPEDSNQTRVDGQTPQPTDENTACKNMKASLENFQVINEDPVPQEEKEEVTI
jgi:ATP-binding cassette subfamily B protein